MASPKDPVYTAGINTTSLPLPGSNCCLEKKKSSFEGEDEKPFCSDASSVPSAGEGWVASCPRRQRQRGHRRWLSGVSCRLGGLDQLAGSWRKSLLESLVRDSGKTSGNTELCPVAPIRQDSLRDGVGGGVARQNLVPLPALFFWVAGGQGAPGHQDRAHRAGQSLRWVVSPQRAIWGLSHDQHWPGTWP